MTPACNNCLVMTPVDFKKISNVLYLYIFLLSVWKEWVIVNNTFEAMLFANGDMCPGEKPRQTKVYTGYPTLQAEPERDNEKEIKGALLAGGYCLSMLNR